MQTELSAPKIFNKTVINVLSVAIPVVVGVLLGIRVKVNLGEWTKMLPHINAVINSLTAILLILGLVFIKQKNIKAHQNMMLAAFSLGSLFLVTYVLYHFSNESTKYPDNGYRMIYLFILISHIVLSMGVVRFVLLSLYYALNKDFVNHKRMTKIAFPIWLYVSITGVIVYLMISPYYT
jgi:putative membrane protein